MNYDNPTTQELLSLYHQGFWQKYGGIPVAQDDQTVTIAFSSEPSSETVDVLAYLFNRAVVKKRIDEGEFDALVKKYAPETTFHSHCIE